MDKTIFENMVQKSIGYEFRNIDLLYQAFTRRSYAEENGGEDNEVLEFIGDKALDLSVTKLLISEHGKLKTEASPIYRSYKVGAFFYDGYLEQRKQEKGKQYFSSDLSEGELTRIKSRMVEKRYLSKRIDELGFAQYLRMGRGDEKNNVGQEASVKEDLFEAIVGAVTIDCNWDLLKIEEAVEAMISFADFLVGDSETNYVRLIQEWEEEVNHVIPLYWFEDISPRNVWYSPFNGISQKFDLRTTNYSNYKHVCMLKVLDRLPVFRGFGTSKSDARMNVCKLAYDYLCDKGIIEEYSIADEIENPNRNEAINQLETLARRGYFSIPKYSFKESYDKDGNPVWRCCCSIVEEIRTFEAVSSSKKDAKKSAAFDMLKYVLYEEN